MNDKDFGDAERLLLGFIKMIAEFEPPPSFFECSDAAAALLLGIFLKSPFSDHSDRMNMFDHLVRIMRCQLEADVLNGKALPDDPTLLRSFFDVEDRLPGAIECRTEVKVARTW